MKLIYIRTSYDKGLVFPMDCLPYLGNIKVVNNEGFNELKDLSSPKREQLTIYIIDSYDIDKKERDTKCLEDAKKDLISNQKLVEELESKLTP